MTSPCGFSSENSIKHLAGAEHLNNVREFLRKYGGGMDRVDSFRVSESDLDKVLLVLLGNLLGFRVFLLSITIALYLFVCHRALFFSGIEGSWNFFGLS